MTRFGFEDSRTDSHADWLRSSLTTTMSPPTCSSLETHFVLSLIFSASRQSMPGSRGGPRWTRRPWFAVLTGHPSC